MLPAAPGEEGGDEPRSPGPPQEGGNPALRRSPRLAASATSDGTPVLQSNAAAGIGGRGGNRGGDRGGGRAPGNRVGDRGGAGWKLRC